MIDDLAQPLLGDPDPVALGDGVVMVVFAGEVFGHRLEAMACDLDSGGEAHHRRLEHQFVSGLGLDEDDVHARIAGLPALFQLVQALVGDELEGLVADLREAHVRNPPGTRAAQRPHAA